MLQTISKYVSKSEQKVVHSFPFFSFFFSSSFTFLFLCCSFASPFPFLEYYRKSMRIKTNLRKIKENQRQSRKIKENQGKSRKTKENQRKQKENQNGISHYFWLHFTGSEKLYKGSFHAKPRSEVAKPNRARSRGRVLNSFIKVGATEPKVTKNCKTDKK